MNLIRSQVHAVAAARGVGDGCAGRVLAEAGPGQPDHSIDGNVTRTNVNVEIYFTLSRRQDGFLQVK